MANVMMSAYFNLNIEPCTSFETMVINRLVDPFQATVLIVILLHVQESKRVLKNRCWNWCLQSWVAVAKDGIPVGSVTLPYPQTLVAGS